MRAPATSIFVPCRFFGCFSATILLVATLKALSTSRIVSGPVGVELAIGSEDVIATHQQLQSSVGKRTLRACHNKTSHSASARNCEDTRARKRIWAKKKEAIQRDGLLNALSEMHNWSTKHIIFDNNRGTPTKRHEVMRMAASGVHVRVRLFNMSRICTRPEPAVHVQICALLNYLFQNGSWMNAKTLASVHPPDSPIHAC